MFVVYLLQWWYGDGWRRQFGLIGERTRKVGKAFSGGALLRTMFSPWKQIVSGNDPNATIADKFRAVIDNLISRLVGFIMRSFTLIAACVTMIATLVVNIGIVVLWPLAPFAPLALAVGWFLL